MSPVLATVKGHEVLESYSPFFEFQQYLDRQRLLATSARAFGFLFNESLVQLPDGSYGTDYYLAVDAMYSPRVIPRFTLLSGTAKANKLVPAKGWGVRKRWTSDWVYQW